MTQTDIREKGTPPQITELYFESDTIDKARLLLAQRASVGLKVISEEIVLDGQEQVLSIDGTTTEEATLQAKKEVPAQAQIIRMTETLSPSKRTVRIQAWSEQEAKAEVEKSIGVDEKVESLRLVGEGRKGFLGIGKSKNDYEISLLKKAIVEVTYKQPAKLRVLLVDRQGADADQRVALLGIQLSNQDRNIQVRAFNALWMEILAASFTSVFYRIMDDALCGRNPQKIQIIKELYMASYLNAISETLKNILGSQQSSIDPLKLGMLNARNWRLCFVESCLDGVRRPYLFECADICRQITVEDICIMEAARKMF